MKLGILAGILPAAVGALLLWQAGESRAQPPTASGPNAEITREGLHRVNPALMEAAFVRPDFDLSSYTKLVDVPPVVQFRDVPKAPSNARSRAMTEEFPLPEDRKEWLGDQWRRAVGEQFARLRSEDIYTSDLTGVLVVQGLLLDVVSRIPPPGSESNYTLVNNPWSATVVLELRDAATGDLLARTVDRRNATGLLELGTVWHRTPDLIERWAQVLVQRLEQLSELGGRPRRALDR
jgi:hypothetical protein